MTSGQKRDALIQLAKERQVDRRDGYLCLSGIHGGYYECDHVSPWSKLAQNVDAELMILGKDWASSETLEDRPPDPKRKEFGQDRGAPTNKNLRAYLRDYMGGLEFSQTFSTNVFPFIKVGKKNNQISAPDMLYAARRYTLPQIKIIAPLMAICLGRPGFLAVSRAALDEGGQEVSNPLPYIVFCGVEIYKVPHPSVYTGGKKAVEQRWAQLGDRLEELRKRGKR
jgi:hypothetical protein